MYRSSIGYLWYEWILDIDGLNWFGLNWMDWYLNGLNWFGLNWMDWYNMYNMYNMYTSIINIFPTYYRYIHSLIVGFL